MATHLPQLDELRLVKMLQEVAVPVVHPLARCRQVMVLQGTLHTRQRGHIEFNLSQKLVSDSDHRHYSGTVVVQQMVTYGIGF